MRTGNILQCTILSVCNIQSAEEQTWHEYPPRKDSTVSTWAIKLYSKWPMWIDVYQVAPSLENIAWPQKSYLGELRQELCWLAFSCTVHMYISRKFWPSVFAFTTQHHNLNFYRMWLKKYPWYEIVGHSSSNAKVVACIWRVRPSTEFPETVKRPGTRWHT